MKKFFVAVALVMGLGTTVAFAENLTSGVETVMAVNDFTPIEVKDLPAAVTEAIAKKFCGINRQGSGGGSGRGWQQDLSGCSDRQGGS